MAIKHNYESEPINYEQYKKSKGELTREEFDSVREYDPSDKEINMAGKYLLDILSQTEIGTLRPDDMKIAAAISAVAKDKFIPAKDGVVNPGNETWLLTETRLYQGLRNPLTGEDFKRD